MDVVRKFTLKDGSVTISRNDGPPRPAWFCVICRGASTHASMAYSARDALRLARGISIAGTVSIAVADPTPPALALTSPPQDLAAAEQIAHLRHYEDLEAAVRARIERARSESMALTHRIGTKDLLGALDVLVDEAVKAQQLGLAEFRAQQAERQIEEAMRGQQRLQADLDALRAQLADSKTEPEAAPAEATETPEPALAGGGEASAPDAPGEAAAPTPAQEAQS